MVDPLQAVGSQPSEKTVNCKEMLEERGLIAKGSNGRKPPVHVFEVAREANEAGGPIATGWAQWWMDLGGFKETFDCRSSYVPKSFENAG